MKNLYTQSDADKCNNDPLRLRVYTSRLLGQDSSLVLHGGGNTSVKTEVANLFGEKEKVLYVKGSGWDLATIEAEGFAPVKMDTLLKMAELDTLDDMTMVKNQRAAMLDPSAPNPSVEAILHAVIPFNFVDHTHADAVVTVTNTPKGKEHVDAIYGDRVLVIPYVMPGFILAREIYKITKEINWSDYEGMVLLNHGIFTWGDTARESYDRMIKLVDEAEQYINKQNAAIDFVETTKVFPSINLFEFAKLRREVSKERGGAVVARLETDSYRTHFANLSNVKKIATRGLLTPDHVIRNKRIPMIIESDVKKSVANFVRDYEKYFKHNTDGTLTCLDPAPRWGIWPNIGTVTFGRTVKECIIISDITHHTMKAIETAEKLGGWKTLGEKDIFEMEYWVLEQAKLKKSGSASIFQGKVAVVTGAASGIGRACVEKLHQFGAVVVALDINPDIRTMFNKSDIIGLVCDLTDEVAIHEAITTTVRNFGGLDIIVSNAGTFPASELLDEMKRSTWDKSINTNLSSHQILMQHALPFLKEGIDPAIVIVGSKNVAAPGPGISAYSVAKAGLTQLARVAALECAAAGIRVNVVHPNAVFDTAIWTDDVLTKRAKNYNMSVDEYKTNNLLKTAITSADVAELVATMAGPVFSKTTGAQVSIDGGNDRTI